MASHLPPPCGLARAERTATQAGIPLTWRASSGRSWSAGAWHHQVQVRSPAPRAASSSFRPARSAAGAGPQPSQMAGHVARLVTFADGAQTPPPAKDPFATTTTRPRAPPPPKVSLDGTQDQRQRSINMVNEGIEVRLASPPPGADDSTSRLRPGICGTPEHRLPCGRGIACVRAGPHPPSVAAAAAGRVGLPRLFALHGRHLVALQRHLLCER